MFLLTQRIRSVYWNCLWLSAAYWVCLCYCFWACLQGIQAVCSSRPTWSSRWRSIRGSVLSASRVVYVVHLITMWVLNTTWFIYVMKCWYFPLILLSFSIMSASYCTYSVCISLQCCVMGKDPDQLQLQSNNFALMPLILSVVIPLLTMITHVDNLEKALSRLVVRKNVDCQ